MPRSVYPCMPIYICTGLCMHVFLKSWRILQRSKISPVYFSTKKYSFVFNSPLYNCIKVRKQSADRKVLYLASTMSLRGTWAIKQSNALVRGQLTFAATFILGIQSYKTSGVSLKSTHFSKSFMLEEAKRRFFIQV